MDHDKKTTYLTSFHPISGLNDKNYLPYAVLPDFRANQRA